MPSNHPKKRNRTKGKRRSGTLPSRHSSHDHHTVKGGTLPDRHRHAKPYRRSRSSGPGFFSRLFGSSDDQPMMGEGYMGGPAEYMGPPAGGPPGYLGGPVDYVGGTPEYMGPPAGGYELQGYEYGAPDPYNQPPLSQLPPTAVGQAWERPLGYAPQAQAVYQPASQTLAQPAGYDPGLGAYQAPVLQSFHSPQPQSYPYGQPIPFPSTNFPSLVQAQPVYSSGRW